MISPHTFSNITEWLENSINSKKLPFGKITISQNNTVIFSEFKNNDLGEYSSNNLYRIQSLTKPITSLVLLVILRKTKENQSKVKKTLKKTNCKKNM